MHLFLCLKKKKKKLVAFDPSARLQTFLQKIVVLFIDAFPYSLTNQVVGEFVIFCNLLTSFMYIHMYMD